MKLIDGRPLWDFRALIACWGSGSGDGMGGEGTGSGAVGPGAGGMGGSSSFGSSDDVGSVSFGGNPDGTAIGTGMSAPGTAALGFDYEGFAPPPVAPVAFAPPAPPVGALQAFAAPAVNNALPAMEMPENVAYANLTGMAPLGSAGFAAIGSPGFGAFGQALGMMNAMHNANPAQQQEAPQSNVAFGTGPTAGMTGASSVGPASGFGTSSFGAPTNTSAGGFSTVGPSMGMGFGNMSGDPIGFDGSGFEAVYGGDAFGFGFGGTAPGFALDDALGFMSASPGGGPFGMTAAQANKGLGFAVPTEKSQAVPSLVGPSGVTSFGAPIGLGLAPPSLATNLGLGNSFTISAAGVPAIGVQTTNFNNPLGVNVQSGMMPNAISQEIEQQVQNAQAAQAAPASAFGLSGPVGMMGNAVTPMDMATALAMSTALNAPPAQEQEAAPPAVNFSMMGALQGLQESLQSLFGISNSTAVGPGMAVAPAVQTPELVNVPFANLNTTPELEQMALALELEGAPPGAAATPAVFGANGVAPAVTPVEAALAALSKTIDFSPEDVHGPLSALSFGAPQVAAAPAAPAGMAVALNEGAFENAGLGMLGAAPAAPAGAAPAIDFANMSIPGMANIDPAVMAAINAMSAVPTAQPATQPATQPAVPAEALATLAALMTAQNAATPATALAPLGPGINISTVPLMESVPAAPLGTPQNPAEIQQPFETNNLQIGAQQAFSPNMLSTVFGLLGGPAGLAAHALATYGTPMTDAWGDNAVGGDDSYGYGQSNVDFDRMPEPAPAAAVATSPGALSAFRRRYLGAGDDLLRYGMAPQGERKYYYDEDEDAA